MTALRAAFLRHLSAGTWYLIAAFLLCGWLVIPITLLGQSSPETVLYSFQGGSDGGYPSPLIMDSSGNLYGAAGVGGVQTNYCSFMALRLTCGVVFELSPNGSGGWTEKVLYSFQGGNDAKGPSSGLIFDNAGNLYGTAGGGALNGGTVYELSPDGSGGWTEKVLYSFSINGPDAYPHGLVFDQSGNLYGTAGGQNLGCTQSGGYPCGSVFELSPNGSGGWTETVIYTFTPQGFSTGYGPNSGLLIDQAGNLYGTTETGELVSSASCPILDVGCGTVFELSPNGSGGWTETGLYGFLGGSDGFFPQGGLVADASGSLFGTTTDGNIVPPGFGKIFKLSPNGSGGWTETTLYAFQGGTDSQYPSAGLTSDGSGNFYGTASAGGASTPCPFSFFSPGCGTVFEISPSGTGTWAETILYSFQGGNDGLLPWGVILDQTGHVYGTTLRGGGGGCGGSGCGMAFELSRVTLAAFSPTNLSFGNQMVNVSSAQQTITFSNTGNLPINITGIQITGTNSADFSQTNNCPSPLPPPPNNSCQINVTFTPLAVGNRSAAVKVTDNAPASPQSIPLTGVGVLPGVTISPTSLDFGTVMVGNQSTSQIVTLTNSGTGTLFINSVSITGTSSSEFGANQCSSSLLPNSSCSIYVTFAPTALGNANAALVVSDSAPGSPQTVPLTGVGVIGISFSPTSITFPSQYVGTSGLPQNVMLTNLSNAQLTISSVTATPSDFAPLSACGSSVPPGNSCSIGVFFDPTASGSRTGVLTIHDSSPDSPQTVSLTGVGQDFSVVPSGSSSSTVSAGHTASYAVSVTPAGGFKQTVTLSCSGAPSLSTCSVSPSSVSLNGSGAASVSVTVATTASSARLAPLRLPSNAGERLAFWLPISGLPLFAIVGMSAGRSRRRRAMLACLALVCMILVAFSMSGCGGSQHNGGGGTPTGNYTITVTGSFASGSAALIHTTKLTLTVQ